MKKTFFLLLVFLQSLFPQASPADNRSQTFQVRGDKDFAPFEYLDESGQPTGFDIDVLKAVAEVMHLDIELRLDTWDVVRRQLEAGEIDALAGMRFSEERDLVLDFSAPYLINTSAIFVQRNSTVTSLNDLKGKKVVIQKGDIMEDYVQEINLNASISFVESQTEALELLAAGEHDAALCSRLRGLYLVCKLKLDNVTTAGSELAGDAYGFAVTEGDRELLDRFNEGLRILKATGRYDTIYDQWFGLYEKRAFYTDLLLYALWVLTPLVLLFVAALFWSWSLKRQVALKSAELEEQYEKHRQVEAHLETERRFRKLVEASPVPMATVSRDAKLHYLNQRFADLVGYSLPELAAHEQWWTRIFTDHARFMEILRSRPEQDSSADPPPRSSSEPVELDIRCRDGTLRYIACRHAIIDERHILVFNDITKRKQTEQALEERIRIETMVSGISSRFINVTSDKIDREIDRALQQIGEEIGVDRCYVFEFSEDGSTMSNTHEWCASGIEAHISRLQECPLDEFSWYLQELSEKGHFYCPSVDDLGPDAQLEKKEWQQEGIQSLVTVAMLLKGKMIGFIGLDSVRRKRELSQELLFLLKIVGESFANALERCRVENRLRAAHQRLQDIIDFLPDPTFVIDQHGRVVAWNNAIEELTGVPKTQILGEGDYAYSIPFYGRRQPTLVDLIRDPATSHHEDYLELKQDNHNFFAEQYLPNIHEGRGAYVWAKASPLYDRQGNLAGAIESIRDISDRKEAQEKLEASNRELEAFVYTVSHDLRSPLTPIIGYAEFLAESCGDRLDSQALSCLDEIRTAGNKMLELMEDLLDLARVGQLDSPDEPIDSGAVVNEVLENYAPQIAEGSCRIAVSPLPRIKVPRTLLYQVFSNFLENAIRYAGHAEQPIEVGGECQAGVATLYVRDHGPGIPESEHDRVFEAFYRGTAGKERSGTGVGLATVQKIARLYGGKAWVDDTPGGGATFWIEMRESDICRAGKP